MVSAGTVKVFTHYLETTLCSVTLIFNVTLIFLIITTRSRVLHGYKYLLLLFAICELSFSTMHMLMEPILLVIRNDVVFFGYGMVGSHPIGPYLLIAWVNALFQIVICLMLHFVYRYVIVVKTKYSFFFHKKRWLFPLMCMYLCGSGTLVLVPLFYSQKDPSLIDRILDRLIAMGLTPDEISIIGAPISIIGDDGDRRYNFLFLSIAVIAILITICAIVCIIWCGRSIHYYLKDAAISERTRGQQKQLLRALLVQTAVPMVCIFIPATVFALGSVCQLDLGVGYFPIFTLFVVFPCLDPLIIVYFITDYRRALLRYLASFSKVFDYSNRSYSSQEEPNELICALNKEKEKYDEVFI